MPDIISIVLSGRSKPANITTLRAARAALVRVELRNLALREKRAGNFGCTVIDRLGYLGASKDRSLV